MWRMPLPPAAEALLALPPARFVAERDALARALAARGDADAGPVRRLRRPVGLSWVMNRLAREHPDAVQVLLAAGERLRAGQRLALAGRGSVELRAAERDLREAARKLRLEAEPLAAERGKEAVPAELARLELLLRVAASAAGPVREALQRGVLGREPEIAAPDLSGLAVFPGGGAPSRLQRGEFARARGGAISGRVAVSVRSERARLFRDGEAEAKRERAAREKRLALAKAVQRGLARAEARAARAERAASAAEARARAARERADAAKVEVGRRRDALAVLERQPLNRRS